MQRARHKSLLTHAVLAAAVAGFVALAGCTMVGDSVTGVSLLKNKTASCIKKCNKKNASALKKENKRHADALKKCAKVTPRHHDSAACMAAEDALHDQKLAVIEAELHQCLNACHRQGGN
jgi:hypothetical protein